MVPVLTYVMLEMMISHLKLPTSRTALIQINKKALDQYVIDGSIYDYIEAVL